MAFDTRKKDMLDYFNTNFSGVAFDQIVWDGVANKNIDKNDPWIGVTIDPITTRFASFNATRRVRHKGLFVVQAFIKPDITTESADDLVNNVADALEGKTTAGGVLFRETEIERIGLNQGYYQVNISTSYSYDDRR